MARMPAKARNPGSLINEGAPLFVKYIRNEKGTWTPRIAIPN